MTVKCSLSFLRTSGRSVRWLCFQWLLEVGVLLVLSACSVLTPRPTQPGIVGQLVDERGTPLAGLEVRIADNRKHAQVVLSDTSGHFEVLYLLDASGALVPLERGQRLTLTVFAPGFDLREASVVYPGMRLVMEPLVLVREVIQIESVEILEPKPGAPSPADPEPTSGTRRGE